MPGGRAAAPLSGMMLGRTMPDLGALRAQIDEDGEPPMAWWRGSPATIYRAALARRLAAMPRDVAARESAWGLLGSIRQFTPAAGLVFDALQAMLEPLGFAVHRLPSTSPANAGWSFERKLAAWRETFARYDLA